MRRISLVFVPLLAVLFLFSCKKNETPANLSCIPQDAQLVLCVNVDTLLQKSEITDFKQSPLYSLLAQDLLSRNQAVLPLLENAKESGLKFERVFAFVTAQGANAISFELADEDDFLDIVQQQIKSSGLKTQIHKTDNYYFVPLPPNDSTILIWDDEKALLFTACNKTDAILSFKTTKEKSILSNKDFANFYTKRKEIAVWAKTEALNSELSKYLQNLYFNLPSSSGAGTFSHLNIGFDKGLIAITNTLSPLDSAKSISAKMFLSKQDDEILKYIPAQTLFFTKAGIQKSMLTEQFGSEEDLAYFLNPTQINAIKAWNGDVVAAVLKSNEYSLPQVLLGVTVSNTAVADWLFADMFARKKQVKLGGYTAIPQQGFAVFVAQKSNRLMLSNNEASIKAFVAGKTIAGSMATVEAVKKSPAYLYMNLDLNSYPILIKSYLQTLGMDDRFNAALLLKEVQMHYDDKTATSFINISLKNSQNNSLAVIANELGKMN